MRRAIRDAAVCRRIADVVRAGRRRLQAGAELAEAAGRDVLRSERSAAAAGGARRASGGAARERTWRRGRRRPERERRGPDQPAGHLRARHRSARSHLRLQPRREAGDGVRHRRQPDPRRAPIRRSTARRSTRRGSIRAASTGTATFTSSSATRTASSSSARSWTSSCCSSGPRTRRATTRRI